MWLTAVWVSGLHVCVMPKNLSGDGIVVCPTPLPLTFSSACTLQQKPLGEGLFEAGSNSEPVEPRSDQHWVYRVSYCPGPAPGSELGKLRGAVLEGDRAHCCATTSGPRGPQSRAGRCPGAHTSGQASIHGRGLAASAQRRQSTLSSKRGATDDLGFWHLRGWEVRGVWPRTNPQ